VLPGLIDCHVHLANAANDMRALDLRQATSRGHLLELLRRHAATLAEGAWLVGTRWSSESWPDQRPPNADEIDEATAGRPAVLIRMDGHSLIASRSALEAAGIDRDGPSDPPGGTIGRDESGRPTGAIYEQAMGIVNQHIVQPEVDMAELLARAIAEANRNGITSVGAIEGRSATEALIALDEAGKLPLRVNVSLSGGGDTIEQWRPLLDWGKANREPSPLVRIIGFKGYMDGSLGSRTAWMMQPYADNAMAVDKAADNAGYPLAMAGSGELEALIHEGAEMGLQPIVHAIGDRANKTLLDWYAGLSEEHRRRLRPRVEHTQHLLPEDVRRFGELGVIASMQPYHKADDGRYAEQRLGPERIKTSYAFRGLLDSGATLAFGSDWPVVTVNPFAGIHAAVTARTLDGKIFVPEQSITVEEALLAYTRNAARALLAERAGVLKPGNFADFVLLDRDVLSVELDNVAQISVRLTVMNGRVVHPQ
jgi:predicted amidohydrolase YtcJ